VKSLDQLTEIYFDSVGRNSKLLLNVPPARDGLLHRTDVSRIAALHERLTALFAEDVAAGHHVAWRVTGPRTAVAELDLGRTVGVGTARLGEDIEHGQAIARYTLSGSAGGSWQELCHGQTIGFQKLDRFEARMVRSVRLVIEDAVAPPRPVRIGLYEGGGP